MYLTRRQKEAVLRRSVFYEIPGNDAEELVQQAILAACTGQAEEAAYSVAEAAGVVWVTPSIWHKERPEVNAEQARALLAQGKKDGTFEAPIPEDDSKAISEANDLVEMAETAWAQMVRGPEVEVLLRMAAEVAGEDPPAPDQNGGQKKAEVDPDLDQPQPDPDPKPKTEQTPESQDTPGEDLSKVEPWEGYDSEKVSDIKAGINAAVREYAEADLTELMANVWAYENAHKGRGTILDHLEGVAKKLQSGEDLDPDPSDAGGDDDDQGVEGRADDSPESVQDDDHGHAKTDAQAQRSDEPEEGSDEPGGDAHPDQPESSSEGDEAGDRRAEDGVRGQEATDQALKGEEKPKRKPRQKKQENQDGDELDDSQRLIGEAKDELARERVHTPKEPEEEVPDLPWDWSSISDKELQKLHGIYSAVAYYKSGQVALDERIGLLCKAAADELHNALLVASEKYDEAGKEKRVAVLEAEIESDENVVLWRRRQRKHETYAAHHRNERDSVGKIVEALSRQETMRQQAWERGKKS